MERIAVRTGCQTSAVQISSVKYPPLSSFIPPTLTFRSAHSRVLWGVTWAPDDRLLATGSRDETVKVWEVLGQGQPQGQDGRGTAVTVVVSERPLVTLPSFHSAVTSLSFALTTGVGAAREGEGSVPSTLLAIGLEDGTMQIWAAVASPSSSLSDLVKSMRCIWATDRFTRFSAAVSAVCWREVDRAQEEGGEGGHGREERHGMRQLQVGASGRDHSVRVFNISGLVNHFGRNLDDID